MDSNIDNIYSDYEKIVPSEKLPQFLFVSNRSLRETTWMKDIYDAPTRQELQLAIQKYNKYKLPADFLDRIFLKLYAKQNKKKLNILFLSYKHSDIILKVKKHHKVGLIIHGKKERLFAIKNFMGYVGINDLDQYALDYLKEKNIKYLYRLVKEVENKLTSIKPDYIVLLHDFSWIERAIALASRKLGITTIEIQHGIYPQPSGPITTGLVVDFVLVWGRYFKDLYLRRNLRKPEDVYVLGYPFLTENGKIAENKNRKYTLCCLGENFEVFNKDFLPIKFLNTDCLSKMCKKLGLKFIYRPHPAEDRELLEKNMPDIYFTKIGERLEETLESADIFISFSSTSLIEAAMAQKISIQLMNYPINAVDNFEKLGVCNKSFKTIEELESYLSKIASAPNLDKFKIKFNNNYIETRFNPGQRFLEIIKEIEKQK